MTSLRRNLPLPPGSRPLAYDDGGCPRLGEKCTAAVPPCRLEDEGPGLSMAKGQTRWSGYWVCHKIPQVMPPVRGAVSAATHIVGMATVAAAEPTSSATRKRLRHPSSVFVRLGQPGEHTSVSTGSDNSRFDGARFARASNPGMFNEIPPGASARNCRDPGRAGVDRRHIGERLSRQSRCDGAGFAVTARSERPSRGG